LAAEAKEVRNWANWRRSYLLKASAQLQLRLTGDFEG
jgi:hypothetical protein